QDLQTIVVIPQAYRRVGYPVKHSCLNDSVVDHILKNYLVANPERLVECPVTNKITCKTAVSSHAIGWFTFHRFMIGTPGSWLIWHFKAVGHMSGKGYIEYGSPDTAIHNNIDYFGDKYSCLPGKGTPGFEYNIEIPLLLEVLEKGYQVFYVIILTSHKVTSTHIDPFCLLQIGSKLLLNSPESLFETIGA